MPASPGRFLFCYPISSLAGTGLVVVAFVLVVSPGSPRENFMQIIPEVYISGRLLASSSSYSEASSSFYFCILRFYQLLPRDDPLRVFPTENAPTSARPGPCLSFPFTSFSYPCSFLSSSSPHPFYDVWLSLFLLSSFFRVNFSRPRASPFLFRPLDEKKDQGLWDHSVFRFERTKRTLALL